MRENHSNQTTPDRLRVEDAQALQQFYNNLSTATKRLFSPIGQEASAADIANIMEQLRRKRRFDIVVRGDDAIVGWAFVAGLDGDVANLGIGLTERYCGQGLGKRLMGRLIEESQRLGKQRIELSVIQTNDRALRLYRNFGFRICGEFRGRYDNLDYFRMRLELGIP